MDKEVKSVSKLIKICATLIMLVNSFFCIGGITIGILMLVGTFTVWRYSQWSGINLVICGIVGFFWSLLIYALLNGFALIVENSYNTEIVDTIKYIKKMMESKHDD